MIYVVLYKNNVEAVFFHIWDAQQHVNFFDKVEREYLDIKRIDERETQLSNLSEFIDEVEQMNCNARCCGNCGRTIWTKDGKLICNFNHKTPILDSICPHYI